MKSLNPRIIRRRDGSGLLTGISYADLSHILTLASLQQYDSEDRSKKRQMEKESDAVKYRAEKNEMMASIVESNMREEEAFMRRIRAILNMLKTQTSPPYTGDDGPISALPRWQALRRLERVKSNRKFRIGLNEMIARIVYQPQMTNPASSRSCSDQP